MAELQTMARPYARAAFEVAAGADALGGWSAALKNFAVLAASEQARPLLGHPAVRSEQLVNLFIGARPDGVPAAVDNFVRVLAENRRLGLLPAIAREFERLRAEHEKRQSVLINSATEIDADRQHAFAAALAKRLGVDVDVSWQVDPDLVGGAVITAGDLVIDGSVRGELQRLRAGLTQ